MIQRRTLISGIVLGLALLSALTLAGVLGKRTRPPRAAPPPALESDARLASQPELQQALLRPADLPQPYATAAPSKATVRRLPTTERCAALLDPNSLVRSNSTQAEATDQATSRLAGPTDLVQLLTTFAGDGAEVTLRELREVGQQCRDFNTVLEDGTPVRVHVEEKPSSGVPVRADTYTLKLTMVGGGRTTAGYLTLGRVGRVLSVLQQMGPVDAVSALDPVKLVDLTLGRLTPSR